MHTKGAQRFIFSCNRTFDTGPPAPIDLLFVPLTLRPRQQAQQCPGLSPWYDEYIIIIIIIIIILSPDEEYRYTTTEFSSCSHSCNCGKKTRQVQCHLFRSGVPVERVDYSFCQRYANQSLFPTNLTMDCNVYPCPDWRAGPWSMVGTINIRPVLLYIFFYMIITQKYVVMRIHVHVCEHSSIFL